MPATATKRKPAACKPAATSKPTFDVYQVVTNKIVDLLEQGTVPWQQTWSNPGGLPRSLSTRRLYRGVNVWLLLVQAMQHGYNSPWWGTYDQIKARGGQVRGPNAVTGERQEGTFVVYFRTFEKEDPATGTLKTFPVLRYFKVFNADQAVWGRGAKSPSTARRWPATSSRTQPPTPSWRTTATRRRCAMEGTGRSTPRPPTRLRCRRVTVSSPRRRTTPPRSTR